MAFKFLCLAGNLRRIIVLSYMDDLTAGFSCCDKTAGKKFISGIFCQIVRLTSQERFVYFHTAFEYFYVCRNLISGFQKDQIVDDQFLCGNLGAVALARRLGAGLHGSFGLNIFNTASLGDAWGMSQSLLAVLGAIPMAVAAVFVVPLANKFGKRLTCLVGMAIGVAGGVIAGLGGSNIIPVAIGIALKCLGSSPACYLILAMLADVIDHIEYTRGIRTDGLTMSVYSALMVAATPVCNAIFSGILNASGYDQSADVALNTLGQSAAVNTAISVSYIWVETAAYALCAVLVFLWTVEKNLPAEQAAIVERKKGATQ